MLKQLLWSLQDRLSIFQIYFPLKYEVTPCHCWWAATPWHGVTFKSAERGPCFGSQFHTKNWRIFSKKNEISFLKERRLTLCFNNVILSCALMLLWLQSPWMLTFVSVSGGSFHLEFRVLASLRRKPHISPDWLLAEKPNGTHVKWRACCRQSAARWMKPPKVHYTTLCFLSLKYTLYLLTFLP